MSVRRYSFIRLKEAFVAEREPLAGRWLHLLQSLAGQGFSFEIGVAADASAVKWDLSLVISANDLASLEAWRTRADVQALFADIAACAEVVKAWNFTVR